MMTGIEFALITEGSKSEKNKMNEKMNTIFKLNR